MIIVITFYIIIVIITFYISNIIITFYIVIISTFYIMLSLLLLLLFTALSSFWRIKNVIVQFNYFFPMYKLTPVIYLYSVTPNRYTQNHLPEWIRFFQFIDPARICFLHKLFLFPFYGIFLSLNFRPLSPRSALELICRLIACFAGTD